MQEKGNKALGRLGEEMACDFLQSRGQRILERNWRSGHLEIDIITEAEDGLHFVEVKACTAPLIIDPYQKVDHRKQQRISNAALSYLNAQKRDLEVFFDVVSIVFDGARADLQYFPQAWIPIYV
jgi:putative endonuclease